MPPNKNADNFDAGVSGTVANWSEDLRCGCGLRRNAQVLTLAGKIRLNGGSCQ